MNMQAQSTYAFSGRKDSNMGRSDALNLYNRRSKSIVGGQGPMSPAAAPSGTGANFMINDTSATKLNAENEVVVVGGNAQAEGQ